MKTTPIDAFGRDHANLLAYAETRCVDFAGKLSTPQMRVNPRWHPEYCLSSRTPFSASHSTRLRGHCEDVPVQTPGHDDLHCLEDFYAARLLEPVLIVHNSGHVAVRMTERGHAVASAIRWHLCQGRHLDAFVAWPNA